MLFLTEPSKSPNWQDLAEIDSKISKLGFGKWKGWAMFVYRSRLPSVSLFLENLWGKNAKEVSVRAWRASGDSASSKDGATCSLQHNRSHIAFLFASFHTYIRAKEKYFWEILADWISLSREKLKSSYDQSEAIELLHSEFEFRRFQSCPLSPRIFGQWWTKSKTGTFPFRVCAYG